MPLTRFCRSGVDGEGVNDKITYVLRLKTYYFVI